MTPVANGRDMARRALACLDLTDLSDACTFEAAGAIVTRARTPFGPVAAVNAERGIQAIKRAVKKFCAVGYDEIAGNRPVAQRTVNVVGQKNGRRILRGRIFFYRRKAG